MTHIRGVCFCYLLLTVFCHGSEQWTITKENGSYRVNGCKLMANGRLADANGTIAKTLTPQELREIGVAIDRFENNHDSPYAKPAIAGPYKTSPPNEEPPMVGKKANEPPPIQAQREEQSNAPASVASAEHVDGPGNKDHTGLYVVLVVIGIFSIGIIRALIPFQCPRCGRFSGDKVESVMIDEHLAVSNGELVNRQRHLNGYRCRNCRHEWLDQTTSNRSS